MSQPDGFPLLTANVKYPLAGPVMMLPCRHDVSGVWILEKQVEKRVRVLGRDPLLEKIGGRSAGWGRGKGMTDAKTPLFARFQPNGDDHRKTQRMLVPVRSLTTQSRRIGLKVLLVVIKQKEREEGKERRDKVIVKSWSSLYMRPARAAEKRRKKDFTSPPAGARISPAKVGTWLHITPGQWQMPHKTLVFFPAVF